MPRLHLNTFSTARNLVCSTTSSSKQRIIPYHESGTIGTQLKSFLMTLRTSGLWTSSMSVASFGSEWKSWIRAHQTCLWTPPIWRAYAKHYVGLRRYGYLHLRFHGQGKYANQEQKFEDLLRIAKLVQVPGTELRRVVRTTLIAAAELYGMEIFCHRVVCRQLPEHDCHQSSLNDLMETAKKVLEIDMRLLGRICWPMLMASMETKDRAQQAWICKLFEEMNAKHGSLFGIERRLNLAYCIQSWYDN